MSSIPMSDLWGMGFQVTLLNSAIHMDISPITVNMGKVMQNRICFHHFIRLSRLCSAAATAAIQGISPILPINKTPNIL